MPADPPLLLAGSALTQGVAYLREHGIDSADTDAALLLAHAAGKPKEWVYMARYAPLAADIFARYSALLQRRAQREPVAYLVGSKEFMSLDLTVDARVLIPRPETEILVEEVIDLVGDPGEKCVLADVGTGSGAIAVALACYLPSCRVVAGDVSEAALEVARTNVRRHRLEERVSLVKGRGLRPLAPWGPYRAIVSNPPYVGRGEAVDVEVERYEPREAWYAGDPLGPYRQLVQEAPAFLEPDGFLAVEVGQGRAE
ncbi:MAG TPA: peptide chain release factor N(5)-glutamine methyltransferase, partial [Firmicutes bacterium]|nr:peptide chain release factor N(5)-glutamine methyltransferase [Bacillota bacterium]